MHLTPTIFTIKLMSIILKKYPEVYGYIKFGRYDTKEGVVRGYHAHKSLEQILVCIHGSCKVRLDNGKEKKWKGTQYLFIR